MPQAIPSWFAADQVYRASNGWYVGSPQGFRVGPYPREAVARERSAEITAELAHCEDTGAMVRSVRRFVYAQNGRIGRPANGAAKAPAAAAPRIQGSVDLPPTRAGEDARVWFRTSRFFSVDDVWFFATREGIDVGPYESKESAQSDAQQLLRRLQAARNDTEARLAIYRFKSRPVHLRTQP
jgi:hypothetical protein